MDSNDLHPPDDFSHRFFIWHEWIQANGPLTTINVFDYFATSMFYDKQSNNQVLRMQTMHTGVPIANEAEELRRFTGIEFALIHAQPPSLFIIQKRERHSPDEVTPLAAYFIINNRIYQSPDVYSILSNRLTTSLHSLQTSLDNLRNHRPDYTPRTGFIWPIIDTSASREASKKRDVGDESAGVADKTEPSSPSPERHKALQSSEPKKKHNDMLLWNAMETTASHSKLSFSASEPGVGHDGTQSGMPGPGPAMLSATSPVIRPDSPQSPSVELGAKAAAGKKKRKRTLTVPLTN